MVCLDADEVYPGCVQVSMVTSWTPLVYDLSSAQYQSWLQLRDAKCVSIVHMFDILQNRILKDNPYIARQKLLCSSQNDNRNFTINSVDLWRLS